MQIQVFPDRYPERFRSHGNQKPKEDCVNQSQKDADALTESRLCGDVTVPHRGRSDDRKVDPLPDRNLLEAGKEDSAKKNEHDVGT